VGLGIAVGGNIGVASAQAAAGGRIVFKKNAAQELLVSFQQAPVLASVPFVGVAEFGTHETATAGQSTAKFGSATASASLFHVSNHVFADGLSRAIKMGAFFAEQAVSVDSPTWKTTEIELGLDASVGGNVGLSTVAGSGLIRLGFERVER
jgi:hypothetical protein